MRRKHNKKKTIKHCEEKCKPISDRGSNTHYEKIINSIVLRIERNNKNHYSY